MKLLDLMTKNSEGEFVPRLATGQRMLFVGRSGSGKGNAGVSFPKPMYVFDIDNRMKGTVSAHKWLGVEEFGKIDFDFYNARDGFAAVDNKLSEIFESSKRGACKYKTIQISSLGSFVQMLALDSQRLRGTDKGFSGKIRGKVKFLHPDDYNYVSTAFRIIMFDYLMPMAEAGINILFDAWVVDKWGKEPGATEYAASTVTGERLIGPDKLCEEFVGYFDEVYYFRRGKPMFQGKPPKYTVEFNGSFAKSALQLPPGEVDITGVNFFQTWKSLVEETNKLKVTDNNAKT